MKKGDIYILQQDINLNSKHFIPKGTEYIYCAYIDIGNKDHTKSHFLKTVSKKPRYGQECYDEDFKKMFTLKGK